MVLILLSTPNYLNPVWPATPRSMDASPSFPRTPLTPSPSFFAILSPIFTPDENEPASPLGFLQLSPGMIPPETPPPWLLKPLSPSTPTRPTSSRIRSYYDASKPTLPRAVTSDRIVRCQQQCERSASPSTTYSFTTGYAQAFRPPPPLALQRTSSQSLTSGISSPLGPALNDTAHSIPELKVRPPSQENLTWTQTSDKDHMQDSGAELLPVNLMSNDSELSSPTEPESMEIPIAFGSPLSTPWDTIPSSGPPTKQQETSSKNFQSTQRFRHSRSPSAPLSSHKDLTASCWSEVQAHTTQSYNLSVLAQSNSYRMTMSVANLRQFDKEIGCSHLQSRQILL